MKVNQIVSEHKKGVRAMKYGKKTKGAVPVYGPDAKDAKLKPVKPVGPSTSKAVNEDDATMAQGKIVANDGKTITVGLPDGTQIQKPIANAIGQDAQGNPVFNVATKQTPATMGQAQQNPAQATAAGQQISVNTGAPVEDVKMGETGEDELAVGGDPTDDYIDDITVGEAPDTPYAVSTGPTGPVAKTGGRGDTPIVPSKLWTAITPEVETTARGQGFRKVTLQYNGKTCFGLEGGDQQLGSKIIVSPSDYQAIKTMNMQRTPGAPAMMEESDRVLLNKMLTIAGLR